MNRWSQFVRQLAAIPFNLIWRLILFINPLAPDEALHRLLWAFASIIATCAVGVVGYWLIEDFSPFDALYQTLLTLTTVGFQEVHPLSREARAFTMFLMIFGVGIALYLIGLIASLIFEGDVYRDIMGRRRRRMIDRLSGHTIFVGAGRMGTITAEQLIASGEQLVIVERDPAAAHKAREREWTVLQDDAELVSALLAAGTERAAKMYVMTGSDPANLVVTLRARQIAPDLYVIARANQPDNEDLMRSAGAAEVVSPAALMARQLLESASG